MVSVETVTSKYDVIELKDMLKEHVAYTNSEKGKEILKDLINGKINKKRFLNIIMSNLITMCYGKR